MPLGSAREIAWWKKPRRRISPDVPAAVPRVSGSVIRRDSKLDSARIHGRRAVDVRSLSGKPRGRSPAGSLPYFSRNPAAAFPPSGHPPRQDTLSSSGRVVSPRRRGASQEREREPLKRLRGTRQLSGTRDRGIPATRILQFLSLSLSSWPRSYC